MTESPYLTPGASGEPPRPPSHNPPPSPGAAPPPPTPPPEDDRRPEIMVGSYGLFSPEIGRGGMGVVYEALDLLGRRWALKMLHEDLATSVRARARFRREAMALAQVDSPHVVQVHHYEEQDGLAWLVMPLLRGETLACRLRRQGAFPVAEAVRIGREAAAGLHAIHSRGLVHRDIKPQNLFLRGEAATTVIMDMGLATRQGDARLTSTGHVVGTPTYLSPERRRSQRGDASPSDRSQRGDASSDVWALGLVMREMLTGELSHSDDDNAPTVSVRRPAEAPPTAATAAPRQDVPPELEALIRRMLADEPAHRPSAAQVRDALAALVL